MTNPTEELSRKSALLEVLKKSADDAYISEWGGTYVTLDGNLDLEILDACIAKLEQQAVLAVLTEIENVMPLETVGMGDSSSINVMEFKDKIAKIRARLKGER